MNNKAFRKLSYGLYVIGSAYEGKINGQIANTVFQISSDPATLAIGINKQNLTNEFIRASKVFSVSVLAKDVPLSLIGNFGFKSGRNTEKYNDIKFELGTNGTPILTESTIAFFEVNVTEIVEVETHTVFIGKVANSDVLNDQEPMTYAYYQQVKRGTGSAATTQMKKYQCTVCGYIYDPAIGDPDSGIAPGTAFEDLPQDWVCPICGVGKDQFEVIA